MLKMAMATALVLALSGGCALAQEAPEDNFYAEPQMADPPLKAEHVFPAAVATQVVATVSPAADVVPPLPQMASTHKDRASAHAAACTRLRPCAVKTPSGR